MKGPCDYCDKVTELPLIALAATAPQLWGSQAPKASLGRYCSRACADAERRPTHEDAQLVAISVCENAPTDPAAKVWRKLVAVYPAPIVAEPSDGALWGE